VQTVAFLFGTINMKILRLPAVLDQTGYRSPASIYKAIHDGTFPKQVRIGARSVGRPDQDVAAINNARIAGSTDVQLRQLVDAIHAERTAMGIHITKQLQASAHRK
jgi:prophage regulatory protein